MSRRSIVEFVSNEGQPLSVDRESGVIRNVKILGLESKNGNRYTTSAIRKAVPMYEGKSVYVDHPEKSKTAVPRSLRDKVGQIRGVKVQEDGLFADFHYNPKHELAEQIVWDATNAPNTFGFSHNALGDGRNDGGKFLVEEIKQVRSVDLVSEPATTKGLYEGEIADEIEDQERESKVRKINDVAIGKIQTVMYHSDGEELTPEQKKARVEEILADWLSEVQSASLSAEDMEESVQNLTEGKALGDFLRKLMEDNELTTADLAGAFDVSPSTMRSILTGEVNRPPDVRLRRAASWLSDKDIDVSFSQLRRLAGADQEDTTEGVMSLTLDELKNKHADLVEQVLAEHRESEEQKAKDTELKQLREQVDAYQAKEKLAEKQRLVESKLSESKLPKEVITDLFREQLMEAKDADAIDALIQDRASFVKAPTAASPTSKPQDRVLSESHGAPEGYEPPKDRKDLASRLRAV